MSLLDESKDFGRFHAKWHADVGEVSEDRWPDWELLKTEGKGRFLGVMLHVMNLSGEECVPTAGEGTPWWGEGGRKILCGRGKFSQYVWNRLGRLFWLCLGQSLVFPKALS
ncbi:MAG: DUF2961 domain-containing protein [Bacteroidales bacterium]|nr:DUF2961 domain-containing protein [Bacteroidales bacterium]